jgi:hypothetical protein
VSEDVNSGKIRGWPLPSTGTREEGPVPPLDRFYRSEIYRIIVCAQKTIITHQSAYNDALKKQLSLTKLLWCTPCEWGNRILWAHLAQLPYSRDSHPYGSLCARCICVNMTQEDRVACASWRHSGTPDIILRITALNDASSQPILGLSASTVEILWPSWATTKKPACRKLNGRPMARKWVRIVY